MKVPIAEVVINLDIVRRLVDSQFPQFTDLPITFLDEGWDNENYRLGDDYIIRLPRRSAAIPLLENEMIWLPRIKHTLPIDIPAPIHIGEPSDLYPWQWTIIPWSNGQNACQVIVDHSEVIRLAEFLKSLHKHKPTDAPYNDHRCLPLSSKSESVIARIKGLMKSTDLVDDIILDLWNQAVSEPVADSALIHGDMHPRNIIIHDGKFNAIIDWGDITSGDVAPDIACIWMMFDQADVRNKGFNHYGADASLISRSRGWAIFYGTLFLGLGDSASSDYQLAGERIMKNIRG